jgi:16S rRNA (guanine527-N7)-methyltransferase
VEQKDLISRGLSLFHIPSDEGVTERLAFFIRELARWNERINLVGLKEAGRIIEDLLYDTFYLYGQLSRSEKILDLGSGSGIVCLPLKILGLGADVSSVDKSLKKVQFQRHIRRSLSIGGFTPIHGRIEIIEPLEVDALVAKAFGTISSILEAGGRHMKAGGRAFIPKGAREEPAEVRGFDLEEVTPYSLPGSGREYRLFVYRKRGRAGAHRPLSI